MRRFFLLSMILMMAAIWTIVGADNEFHSSIMTEKTDANLNKEKSINPVRTGISKGIELKDSKLVMKSGAAVTIDSIFFGVLEGKLSLAKFRGRLPDGSQVTKDNTDNMEYMVENLRDTGPIQIDVICKDSLYTSLIVSGITLGIYPDGSAFVDSMKLLNELTGTYEWEGCGGAKDQWCVDNFTISCDNSFCWGNCIVDFPDCDFCDCDGTGFCLENFVILACLDFGCIARGGDCHFQNPPCHCICVGDTIRLGACCVEDECVATILQDDCSALGGAWYAEEDCGTFVCPDSIPCIDSITVDIFTDNNPGETTWDIVNQVTGTIVASGGPLSNPQTQYHWDVCVDWDSCYTFTIYDDSGDGICCAFGVGHYEVYYNGDMVCQGGEFDSSESCLYIGDCPSDPVMIHFVTPDTATTVDGNMSFTAIEWSDTHLITGFSGSFLIDETREECTEQLDKILKVLMDAPALKAFYRGGPPVLQNLTGGNFTGDCDITGPCGQFSAIFESTPDTIRGIYDCNVPDSVCGDTVHCTAFGIMLETQPGVAQETCEFREWIEPDLACTSLVEMTTYFDSSIGLLGPQTIKLSFSSLRTSDTTFIFGGVATIRLWDYDTGACCDTITGICVDGVLETECFGRFEAYTMCADLDPPCGSCDYVVGDVNGSDSYNGLDIIYAVNYFKGGPDPMCPLGSCPIPPCDTFFYCGDVNGSCSFNGLDVTYGVNFFKGGLAPAPCPNCPPSN